MKNTTSSKGKMCVLALPRGHHERLAALYCRHLRGAQTRENSGTHVTDV